MAGALTAIGVAMVVSWISNSELTIKEPAAGRIVITLGGIQDMSHQLVGRVESYRAVLAIGVAAGGAPIVFGMMRLGGLGDFISVCRCPWNHVGHWRDRSQQAAPHIPWCGARG
jgi:MFS superfamily sulfate permease-like transporter